MTGCVPERSAGCVPERSAGCVPERSAGCVPERSTGCVPERSADVSDADRRAVAALLGREPGGAFSVAVRGSDGRPMVIRNDPLLRDGTPMPTRWWLVDAELRRAVSGLEAGGGVREAAAAVDPDELAEAHARYAAERDTALPPDHQGPRPTGGVGGTRKGVKCLHAHYAWFLAGGDDPVGRWVHARLQG
ncbi:MAG TPA: DUF501 domain-containing protein [Acidimicrobiales bacterium]|nr:DUF501 domain-containing protein [Acidimicrobiales bacterium]